MLKREDGNLKNNKKAHRLFSRLTRRLQLELFRSGAFKALKQKKLRPADGTYNIFLPTGLKFSLHVIGRQIFVNSSTRNI